ncbi:MAG: hypothetical protein O3B41_03845 [Bacteroidetes bacterium]|nr:hypothetical protein [Bacteroidota bacterium]
MRSQIKLIVGCSLFAILAFGSANVVLAQGRGGQQTPAEQKAAFDANFASLTTTLALTEEQSPKVKEILWSAQEKRVKTMMELRASGQAGGNREAMRGKMSELEKETVAALGDVLTADQLKKYSEVQAAQQQQRRGGGGRPPGQGR